MAHLDPPKGAVAHLLYYDDFTRTHRLRAPVAAALWLIGAGLVIAWIVAVVAAKAP